MTQSPGNSQASDASSASPPIPEIVNQRADANEYLQRSSGDLLTAADWNSMQKLIHQHINQAYEDLKRVALNINQLYQDLDRVNAAWMSRFEDLPVKRDVNGINICNNPLKISEKTGSASVAGGGSLVVEHLDSGGSSSIVFPSKDNPQSDFAYLEYLEKSPLFPSQEASLLIIGIENDSVDHIALMPSGNLGIGTKTPSHKLTLNYLWQSNRKDPESDLNSMGGIAIKSNRPQLDFVDLDANDRDWSIHVDTSKLYFVRQPWSNNDLVLDGTGRIGMGIDSPISKLHIMESAGTSAGANSGSLVLDHGDSGGSSSIVFRSAVNRGSDYAFLEFKDKNSGINDTEAALLTIGMQNDSNDHIALMASGNVGIGTTTPGNKLTVQSNHNICRDADSGISCGGSFAIKSNAPQIDFIDTDHNDWAIHVNSNKMYFIRQPWEYRDLVLDGSGKVGIGTDNPSAKLQIYVENRGVDGLRITFPDGYWVFQADGNLVKYNSNGSVLWAINHDKGNAGW